MPYSDCISMKLRYRRCVLYFPLNKKNSLDMDTDNYSGSSHVDAYTISSMTSAMNYIIILCVHTHNPLQVLFGFIPNFLNILAMS